MCTNARVCVHAWVHTHTPSVSLGAWRGRLVCFYPLAAELCPSFGRHGAVYRLSEGGTLLLSGRPSELASQLLFSKPTSRSQKEMAQQLRALILGEALGSNPRTYTAAHTYL